MKEVKRTITEINLSGDFKLRFDPKEVRISIDGDRIDVGARRIEEQQSIEHGIIDPLYFNPFWEADTMAIKDNERVFFNKETGERLKSSELRKRLGFPEKLTD